MRKAYSYLRFSTPRQEWGDSSRRQKDSALRYVLAHPELVLANEELEDRGVSGYTGANMDDASALGEFIKAVYSGHIERGSVLLVENLDRLSRQAAWRASTLLGNLCIAGLTVVTLNDERVYSAQELDADQFALFYAVVGFMRGHEESATKSRRVRAAWEEKRRKAAKGEAILTKIAPGWLRYDEQTRAFVVVEERAEIVRRIFAETLAGVGRKTIAVGLNADGVPTFGSKGNLWRSSYVGTVQRNPAVIGVLRPERSETVDGKRLRPAAGDPIPGYYPPVVDEETWLRVKAMTDNAAAPQRGRHTNAPLVNPFAGLLKCSKCGGAVVLVSHGINRRRGQKAYIRVVVCERARLGAKKGGGCVFVSVRLEKLIDALKHDGPSLAPLAPVGAEDAHTLDHEIATADAEAAHFEMMMENLTDEVAAGGGDFVRDRLRKLETIYETVKQRRDALLERRAASGGPLLKRKLADLEDALAAEEFDVVRINSILRQCFVAAVLDTDAGQVLMQWAHGGESPLIYDYGFTVEPLEPTTKAKRVRKPKAAAAKRDTKAPAKTARAVKSKAPAAR